MAPNVTLSLALFALLVSCKPLAGRNARPTVQIDTGTVAGVTATVPATSNHINKFLGIPFGAPPVRFEPAKPVKSWSGVYDASSRKATCVQKFNYPDEMRERMIKWYNTPAPSGGEGEDCLNLNVFAPAGAAPGSKAVMFWIYGGGFGFGSGALEMYDGSDMAANQDVIVVTSNYRTNVFGFPGSPEIPTSKQNLGFLDQHLALDWVQRNIRAFGGDPKRVTIFGESAGAGIVDALIAAPPNPVPFSAAIMQSGQASIFIGQSQSATSWKKLVTLTNCTCDAELECVRNLPANQIKEVVERNALSFYPIHDGGATWADRGRRDRLQSVVVPNRVARVPILIGSNADEGKTFVFGETDTTKFLTTLLGPLANPVVIATIIAAYPIGSPGITNSNDQIATIYGEFAFQCTGATVAADSSLVGIPTWSYYYNASFPNADIFPGSGAYHAAEIPTIFGTYPTKGATPFQKTTSKALQKAWASFAKNPTNGPGWSRFPNIGVLGGGARLEVSDDTGRVPIVDGSAARALLIHKRCGLYKAAYDAVTFL